MVLNHTVLLRHKPGHLCLILVSRSETVHMCVFAVRDAAVPFFSCIQKVRNAKISNATVTKVSAVMPEIPVLNHLCNKTSRGCEISRLHFCASFQRSVSSLLQATQTPLR